VIVGKMTLACPLKPEGSAHSPTPHYPTPRSPSVPPSMSGLRLSSSSSSTICTSVALIHRLAEIESRPAMMRLNCL
jgi:hypothetical protein